MTMEHKNCTKCGFSKSIEEFSKDKYKKSGYTSACTKCRYDQKSKNKEMVSRHNKTYRDKNHEKILASRRSDSGKEYDRIYRQNNPRIYSPEYRHEYYINNKDRARDLARVYVGNRRKNDLNYKLISNLRSRLYSALKRNTKTGSAIKDLGCSIDELKKYLESKFEPGMSWDNYGKWHIDHIVPISCFDLTKREQLLKACHYINLQPLWAIENFKKSNKVA